MTADATPFAPARLLAHRHAQTIFPALFRRAQPPALATESWPTDDGEAIDVDLLAHAPGRPGVLVLHGLEGSSRAPYVRGLLAAVAARGWNGAALNFRSCGPTPVRGPRLYHSGDTRDLPVALARLAARWTAPLAVVGFSMGGNVLLKHLGEAGEDTPVAAAVAVSVPYDLAACAALLDGAGLFAAVYRERFLRSLRRKALALSARHPGALDAAVVRACRSFAAFDERVTAPLFGFAGAADYWTRSSSAPLLPGVRRPTLLLSAEDDPFIPPHALPRAAVAANPALRARFSARGGHVGFVAGAPWRPVYDVDACALAFVAGVLGE
jgi:predicted alpha/beta-fold hydrolase